jgi:hypothetical protein
MELNILYYIFVKCFLCGKLSKEIMHKENYVKKYFREDRKLSVVFDVLVNLASFQHLVSLIQEDSNLNLMQFFGFRIRLVYVS